MNQSERKKSSSSNLSPSRYSLRKCQKLPKHVALYTSQRSTHILSLVMKWAILYSRFLIDMGGPKATRGVRNKQTTKYVCQSHLLPAHSQAAVHSVGHRLAEARPSHPRRGSRVRVSLRERRACCWCEPFRIEGVLRSLSSHFRNAVCRVKAL